MPAAVAAILIAITLSSGICFGQTPTPPVEPKPQPIEQVIRQLKLLSRRVPLGRTKLQQQDGLEELRRQIVNELDGIPVEYDLRIKSIDWRGGTAILKTTAPVPPGRPAGHHGYQLQASPSQPLSIPLEREQAMALNPRSPLTITGKLRFVEGRWGNVAHPPKSQCVCLMKHPLHIHGFYGAFLVEEYIIEIGGKFLYRSFTADTAKTAR